MATRSVSEGEVVFIPWTGLKKVSRFIVADRKPETRVGARTFFNFHRGSEAMNPPRSRDGLPGPLLNFGDRLYVGIDEVLRSTAEVKQSPGF